MKGKLKVYWADSKGVVHSDYADSVTAKEVRFADGGWNHLRDCYLTERQCRRALRLPEPPKPHLFIVARIALKLLEAAVEKLKEVLPDAPDQR